MISRRWSLVFGLALGACGDDGHEHNHDTTTTTAADTADTQSSETTTATETVEETTPEIEDDVADGETVTPVGPQPIALGFSAAGPDQLQAATVGPDGEVYAVGFSQVDMSAPRLVFVARLDEDGLDTDWAEGGRAVTELEHKGGNDELEIVIQQDGRIIVAAAVANADQPLDTDVAFVALKSSDGTVDAGFGEEGSLVVNLDDAIIDGTTVTGADRPRALALDATDRIYLHAVRLASGQFAGADRTDTDFSLRRFTKDGDADDTFGGGEVLIDIRGGEPDLIPSSATPRGIAVLADGSLIGSGYATTDGLGANPQPVLYKVDDDGVAIDAFAIDGLFHDIVLSTQTEVYGFVVHGSHLVTAGYGRESGDQNDWVSMRFDVATGARDTTWGGDDAIDGTVVVDPSDRSLGDNCRGIVALPGGRSLLFGSSGPGNAPEQDAAYVTLDADGVVDGKHVVQFGAAGGNDQLWGATVAGDKVYLVGYRGGGPAADQTAEKNDDAFMLVVPIE